MNISINIPFGTPVDEVAAYVQALRAAIPGVETVHAPKERVPAERVQGPLEKIWCDMKGVEQVKRMSGRTYEQQAEHNLRTAGWTDARIMEAQEAAGVTEETPAPTVDTPTNPAQDDDTIIDDSTLL